jgi:hypothetical protein
MDTLEEFKARCVARLGQYASQKGEDSSAGHYFEDVSLLLKLLSVQAIRSENQLFRMAKKL